MIYKKLSDFKGEDEAFEVLEKIIDPLAELASDKVVQEAFGKGLKEAAEYIVKSHKTAVTKLLAALACKEYEDFKQEITPASILLGTLTVLNDGELLDLFQSQG